MINSKSLLAVFAIAGFGSSVFAQSGNVYTLAGVPIVGAKVTLQTAAKSTFTDEKGHYDFALVGISSSTTLPGYSLQTAGGVLSLGLEKEQKVTLTVFSTSGKSLRRLADGTFPSGNHRFSLAGMERAGQLCLLKVEIGPGTAWHKLTLQGSFAAMAGFAALSADAAPAAKTTAAVESLIVTHPSFNGGLIGMHAKASKTTAPVDFRMVSTDPAWNVCAPPITFNFDGSAGASYYKKLIPDPQATEQEVLREICQSIWKLPSQAKKYTSYTANIKSMGGVANTGGSTLNFSTDYLNNKPLYELIGVQVHEGTHSYQPYYNTTGASGFGEAMPDAVRGLTGYFRWPSGTKCSGSFTAAYQEGGKYWFYIEMVHPGFLSAVWQTSTGDISARVQTITGESLATLTAACQSKGMP